MIEKRREPEKEGNARWARTCATSGTSDENGDPWGSIGHGSPLPTRSKHQLFLRREEKDQAGRYLVEAEQLLEKSRRIEREREREWENRRKGRWATDLDGRKGDIIVWMDRIISGTFAYRRWNDWEFRDRVGLPNPVQLG